MPGAGRTCYIAGAGISGLTLALSLARAGTNVVLLERSPALSEFGAGLQISPNARKILDNLGLDRALAERSLEPTGIDIYPHDGHKPLVTLELGATMRAEFGAPYAVMHRADLADTLYRAATALPEIDIRFGIRSWSVVSEADGVTVNLEDAEGKSTTHQGFAFIGADGVQSRTRTELLEGPAARYGGRVAWRSLVPFDAIAGQVALDRVSVLFGPDYHMVCYPLPHRRQVNLALFVKGAQAQDELGSRPVLPGSAPSNPLRDALLAAADAGWTLWPLYTVSTPQWHKGNIGILGDAAHAMVPFQAQGAAMAIEDAAVLAPLLATEADAGEAFDRYQRQRRGRVERVARLSATNGRIFHMRWPLSMARDMAIRLQGRRGHLRRLAWLYGHEPDTGAAVTTEWRDPG